MARPPVLPTWATNATYPAGSQDWANQPPRVQPAGAVLAQGLTPATDLPAEYINWLLGVAFDWINYNDATRNTQQFGTGADGSVTLDGVAAAPAWATKSGTVYTMTRDATVQNLTVTGAGVQLNTNGWRLWGNGTLTTAGGAIVNNNGKAGVLGVAGVATTANTLGNGSAGGAGTQGGAGVAGSAITNALGGAGGAGGTSGAPGPGGAAGTVTAPAAARGTPYVYPYDGLGMLGGNGTWVQLNGGSGGGGGGETGATGPGGGGGGGGGVMSISFRYIVLANASDLQALGGGGGAGGGTVSGGGGGGGGGLFLLNYTLLTIAAGVMSSAVNCAGGVGGAAHGGAPGAPGANGSTGLLIDFGG